MRLFFNNMFFYKCYIAILIFLYMLESTSLNGFDESLLHDFLQYTAILLIIICILLSNFSLKKLLQLIVLNIIGILCFLSSGLSGLLFTVLAITILPPGKLDNVLKFILRIEIFLFICIVTSSLIGFIPNLFLLVDKGSYIVKTYSYGFSHPNMLAAQAASILFLFLCVNRNCLTKKDIILSYITVFIIYYFSKGRTSLIIGLMTIVFISLRDNKLIQKFILKLIPYCYILVLLSLILIFLLFYKYGENNELIRMINDGIFNGRIGLAYRSLKAYQITFFGKVIDLNYWNEWQYFSLDNGQVMVLLEYGIIGFVSYFWFIQQTLNNLKIRKEVVLSIVMIAFLFWSMYEGTMYFIGKNFALLFLSTSEYGLLTKRGEKI